MSKPKLEVADIIREHGEAFLAAHSVSPAQKRILRDLVECRTAAKGAHLERCDHCGYETIAYNSCRNRHCPKCQESAQAQWLSDREEELLPVEYFHVIFSVPEEIAKIAYQNKKAVYAILFRASWETLRQIAGDPNYLGAEIGVLSVLHTWGQNLHHHPHVHCLVPGGGLSLDRTHWVPCQAGFFLPVRVLSRLFRGKFLHSLKEAFERGKLSFFGEMEHLQDPEAFRAYLAPLYEKDWFVYCRPPFGSPDRVLQYLSRYTHRVAISNHRLVEMNDGKVSFRWKDYANGCQNRILTLTGVEFLRRFSLHVLPKGLVRIRHFGFFANRVRKEKLAFCRTLLHQQGQSTHVKRVERLLEEVQTHPLCPHCKQGRMIFVSTFAPGQSFTPTVRSPVIEDTS